MRVSRDKAEQDYRVVQRALELQRRSPSPSLSLELTALFDELAPRVRSYCRRKVGDPQLAEELAQEAQLVAYSKLAEFKPGYPFAAWVHGIARNLCANAIAKRRELLADDGVLDACDEDARSALKDMHAEARMELIREAAAALDPQEQEAVRLRYTLGLSQDRITEQLGLDGTGARALLQRCRRKLGRSLALKLEKMGHGKSFFDSI